MQAVLDDFRLVTLGTALPPALEALLDGRPVDHIRCDAITRSQRNLLAARIDDVVTRADRAVLLMAEGAGCFATAWWARLSPPDYVSRVAGALFFSPARGEDDVDSLQGSFASPRTRLPFPSMLVHGDAAPGPERLRALADSWGSGLVQEDLGAVRLLRRTQRMIGRFTSIVVEREVRAARALMGDTAAWRS